MGVRLIAALVLAACRPDDPADDGTDTDRPGSTAETGIPGTPTGATGETGGDCAALCDDGLSCSLDTCDALGRCIAVPLSTCPWPAQLPPGGMALAPLDPDLRISLSGATWNADARALWTVRGNGATAWRFVEDGAGGYAIDGKWSLGDLDLESIAVVDPVGAPELVHVMVELEEVVVALDLSGPTPVRVRTWDTSPWLPRSGTLGSEGLAFVPDTALTSWGFVDPLGAPRTSALGMGGLFFVGHQNGGLVHVFDLSAASAAVEYVGGYDTARNDTSALEFDAGTGRLYLWHGDGSNDLEVARLSSTDVGAGRRLLDAEYVFDFPESPLAANVEGFALTGLEDCGPAGRPFFLATDDGGDRALDVYAGWPLCRP